MVGGEPLRAPEVREEMQFAAVVFVESAALCTDASVCCFWVRHEDLVSSVLVRVFSSGPIGMGTMAKSPLSNEVLAVVLMKRQLAAWLWSEAWPALNM